MASSKAKTTSSSSSSSSVQVDDEVDDVKGIQALGAAAQKGLFGTAFVLSRDSGSTSARVAILFAFIELVQLSSFPLSLINDSPGLRPLFLATDYITTGAFNRFVESYGFTVILVLVMAIVTAFLGLTFVVASRFVTDAAQSRSMLRVLRILANLSTSILFIPFAGVLMQTFHCHGAEGMDTGRWMRTSLVCGSVGHTVLGSVTGLLLALFALISLFLAATFVDTNPSSRSWSAKVHGRLDVAIIIMKLVLTFTWEVADDLHPEGPSAATVPAAALLVAAGMGWLSLIWVYVPFVTMPMNAVTVAEAALFAWCALAAFINRSAPSWELDPSLMVLLGGPAVGIAVYYAFLQQLDAFGKLPRTAVKDSVTSLELWARLRVRQLLNNPLFQAFTQGRNTTRTVGHKACLALLLDAWKEQLVHDRVLVVDDRHHVHPSAAKANGRACGTPEGLSSRQERPSRTQQQQQQQQQREQQPAQWADVPAAAAARKPAGDKPPSLGLASKRASKLPRQSAAMDNEESEGEAFLGNKATSTSGRDRRQLEKLADDELEHRKQIHTVYAVLAGVDQAVDAYDYLATNFITSELALVLSASFMQAYSPFEYGSLLALHRVTLLNPSVDTQFIVFRRIKQLQLRDTKSAGKDVASAANVVDRVLIEQNTRQIAHLRLSAYRVTSRMWDALASHVVDLGVVAKYGQKLQDELAELERLYKTVLKADPNSAVMLRGYAAFLRDQKHSDDAGQELDNKAERIEEAHLRRRNRTIRQVVFGQRHHGQLDESDASSAVIVVSGEPGSLGEISQVSLGACRLLQFRTAQQIVGTNVKDIVPEPFRSSHDTYLEGFGSKQTSNVIGHAVCMFASTSIGVITPVWLQVNEAPPNPITAAPRFTAVMEQISTTEQHIICGTSANDFQMHAASAASLDLLGLAPDSLKAEDPVMTSTFFPTLARQFQPMELAIGLRTMQLVSAGTFADREAGVATPVLDATDRPRASSWLGPDAEGLTFMRTAALSALESHGGDLDEQPMLPGTINDVIHASEDQAVFSVGPLLKAQEKECLIPVSSVSSGHNLAAVVFGSMQVINRGGKRCILIRWRAPTDFLRRNRTGAAGRTAAASRASMMTPSYLRSAAGPSPTLPVPSGGTMPVDDGAVALAAAETGAAAAAAALATEGAGVDDHSVLGSLADEEEEDEGEESASGKEASPQHDLVPSDQTGRRLSCDPSARTQSGAPVDGPILEVPAAEEASASGAVLRRRHQWQPEAQRLLDQTASVGAGDDGDCAIVSFAQQDSSARGTVPTKAKPMRAGSRKRLESVPGALRASKSKATDRGAAPRSMRSGTDGRSSRVSGGSASSSRLANILTHQRKLRDADVSSVKFVMLLVTILVICIGAGDLFWLRTTNDKLAALLAGLLQSGDRVIRTQQCTASIVEMVASAGGLEGKLFDTVDVARDRFVGLVEELQLVHEGIYVAGDAYGAVAAHYETTEPLMMNELSSEFLGAWLEDSMNNSMGAARMAIDDTTAVCPNTTVCDPRAMAFVSLASVDFWLDPARILEVNQIDPFYSYDNTSEMAPYLTPSADWETQQRQKEFLKTLPVVADSFSMPLAQYGEYYASILLRLTTLERDELNYENRDIRNALANDEGFLRGANVSLQLRAKEITEMLPLIETRLIIAGSISFVGILLLQTWLIGMFVSRLASRTRAMLRMLLLVPRRACKQASRLAELRWRRLEQRDTGSSDREEVGLDQDIDEAESGDESAGNPGGSTRQLVAPQPLDVDERLHRANVAADNQEAAAHRPLRSAPSGMARSTYSVPDSVGRRSDASGDGRLSWSRKVAVKLRPHSDSSRFLVNNSMRFVAPTVLILLWLVLLFINQLVQQRSLQSLSERVVVVSLLAQQTIGYSTDLVASVLAATPEDRLQARLRVTKMDDEVLHLADVALFGGAMELTAPEIVVHATALEDTNGAFGVFVEDGCALSSEPETCGEVGGGILTKGAYSGLLGLVALGRKLVSELPSPATDPGVPLVFGFHENIVADLTSAYHLVEPHLKDSLQGMTHILAEEMNKELDTLWNRALWGTIAFAVLFTTMSLVGVFSANRLTLQLESARLMMSQIPATVRQRVPALRQAVKDIISEPDMSVVNVRFDSSTTKLQSTGRSCMGNGQSQSSRGKHNRRSSVAPSRSNSSN